jgi:hypothetical protein
MFSNILNLCLSLRVRYKSKMERRSSWLLWTSHIRARFPTCQQRCQTIRCPVALLTWTSLGSRPPSRNDDTQGSTAKMANSLDIKWEHYYSSLRQNVSTPKLQNLMTFHFRFLNQKFSPAKQQWSFRGLKYYFSQIVWYKWRSTSLIITTMFKHT